MNIIDILEKLSASILKGGPYVLMALAIAIFGWIAAKILSRLLKRLLVSIQIDKLADRLNQIELIEKTKIKLELSTVISKLFYYIMLLIVLVAASESLEMDAISNLISELVSYVPSLLSALAVFVVGLLIADFIRNIVLTTCNSLGIPSAKIIASVIFYFLFVTVAMSALAQAKINTDFINNNITIIIAGIVLAFAIGYGLASKDLMANFLASFYTKNKVIVGDIIQIENVKGKVIDIDNTSLTIDVGDKKVVIPLSKLTNHTFERYD